MGELVYLAAFAPDVVVRRTGVTKVGLGFSLTLKRTCHQNRRIVVGTDAYSTSRAACIKFGVENKRCCSAGGKALD
jgi:hypothetical protein